MLGIFHYGVVRAEAKKNRIFREKRLIISNLQGNSDGFYSTFKEIDFRVRNIDNITEYKKIIAESIDDFTFEEKKQLLAAIRKADKYLITIREPWFNGVKCSRIPWRIGCIVGNKYEAGLPHTRNDLILFPRSYLSRKEESYIKTLIHERVHIYQKMYVDDAKLYIDRHGFKRYKLLKTVNSRANPDADDWIYTNSKGDILMAEYVDGAKKITDVKFKPDNNQKSEHPLEKMALDIADGY
jgi:hypothetical protein